VTLGQKLAIDRASRDAAKDALASRLDQVREDLETRSIGGRIADKVTSNAAEAAGEAVDVVRANKSVVAGTVLAIIVWIFRHPLLALFHRTDEETDEEGAEGTSGEDQEKE
jgi:hypothetical protein